jgi:hypothetical protein
MAASSSSDFERIPVHEIRRLRQEVASLHSDLRMERDKGLLLERRNAALSAEVDCLRPANDAMSEITNESNASLAIVVEAQQLVDVSMSQVFAIIELYSRRLRTLLSVTF